MSAYWRNCGSTTKAGVGSYNVRAPHHGCKSARQIARQFSYFKLKDGEFPVGIGIYSCTTRQKGSKLWRVECRFEDERIQFVWGF